MVMIFIFDGVTLQTSHIQRYCTVICTEENLFVVQVGARTQNCHALSLSLINLLTTAVR